MKAYPAYATAFELYPKEGEAFQHLAPLLSQLERVNFTLRVKDPAVNQGQMTSDFDEMLEVALLGFGARRLKLRLPSDVPQDLDFAFVFEGRQVAVEIEKTNQEKILRDILKCHIYLHAGADFAVLGLPRNYPHKHSVWNLFKFGCDRFSECKRYGFGTGDKLGSILLLGYEQYDASTNKPLSRNTRQQMRDEVTVTSRRR